VRNFARHDGGRTLKVVQKTMEDLGYAFYWKVLSALDYGVPQKRERVYMVCFRKDFGGVNFEFPKPVPLVRHVEDFLLPESDETLALCDERYPMVFNPKKKEKYSSKAIKLAIVNKGGQGERVYSTKGIAVTLSAYGGGVFAKTGGYLVNGKPRRLHPRECARLMGYPDSYKISKRPNQAYKQFGNSVVVDVLQFIALQIAKTLKSAN
ncbi:MAG: DNA (cytosine-5-)-methyltransferase, partial [Treponema sp.]|nr:DNA (cytosine-5-)-methyltransferase [Treponema sp.]